MEIQISRDLNSVSTGVHAIVSKGSSARIFRVKQPKMKTLSFFETSVTIYKLTRCDIPEDLGFGKQRCRTLQSVLVLKYYRICSYWSVTTTL